MISSPRVPYAFPHPWHNVERMTGIIFTHSTGYKQLLCVVQSEDDNISHVNGLPVHKAKHVFPCSVN